MARKKSNGQGKEHLSTVTVQDTIAALRKNQAQEIETIYARAVKRVGNELQYSSARHLTMGLVGLMNDAFNSFYESGKRVLNSEVLAGLLEEEMGGQGTLVDYLKSELKGKTRLSSLDYGAAVEGIDSAVNKLSRKEAYHQAITAYCQEHGKTPEQVLRSKKTMLGIINQSYGSLDEYARQQQEALESTEKLIKKLDLLQTLPLGDMAPLLLEQRANLNLDRLSEIGINVPELGQIGQSYIQDVAVFGKAFLEESSKYSTQQLDQYKRLALKH